IPLPLRVDGRTRAATHGKLFTWSCMMTPARERMDIMQGPYQRLVWRQRSKERWIVHKRRRPVNIEHRAYIAYPFPASDVAGACRREAFLSCLQRSSDASHVN